MQRRLYSHWLSCANNDDNPCVCGGRLGSWGEDEGPTFAGHKRRLCTLTLHAFIVNRYCVLELCRARVWWHVDQERDLLSTMQRGVSYAWTFTYIIIWCWTVQNRLELLCMSYTVYMYTVFFLSQMIVMLKKAGALSLHKLEHRRWLRTLYKRNFKAMTALRAISFVQYGLSRLFCTCFHENSRLWFLCKVYSHDEYNYCDSILVCIV